jgi:adenine-specific DNA methylase
MNKSFIEVQFPVSKLSKESYKERKAGDSQTLASLGKWHGRKPLVLVRAVILGLLMPATDNPAKDREIFLKTMTMDDEGMWRRCKGINAKEAIHHLTPAEREESLSESGGKISWARGMSEEKKKRYQKRAFLRMSYDERLKYCLRPEEIEGPDEATWKEINAHLHTSASNIVELFQELGKARFGHVPVVGDSFAGGGSIPFEAARIGCNVVANDLNPTSVLMNYGALKLIGGSEETMAKVKAAQREVFEAVQKQVREWGIERNDLGWEADVYLYCNEVLDPVTGWRVPLLPTFVVDPGQKVIVKMEPELASKTIHLTVHENVSAEVLTAAKSEKTSEKGVLTPFDDLGTYIPVNLRQTTSSSTLRGQHGLRPWEKSDWTPRPDDVYQERLFCIRWILPNLKRLLCLEQLLRSDETAEKWTIESIAAAIESVLLRMDVSDRDLIKHARMSRWGSAAKSLLAAIDKEDAKAILAAQRELQVSIRDGIEACGRQPNRAYATPSPADLQRESFVHELLTERFDDWQEVGYIPSIPILKGNNIGLPLAARGWRFWHHLHNPRQLLLNGLFAAESQKRNDDEIVKVALLLSQMKLADWCGKICRWDSSGSKCQQLFYAPGIPSPFVNYACRALKQYENLFNINIKSVPVAAASSIALGDASQLNAVADLWVTDPGYGDMISYAQTSELFLAWVSDRLQQLPFIDYTDSKRALAVEEAGKSFCSVLHACYANLANHMPDNGFQVVMFTSQDAQVWADLCLLLGAAGLHVVQAWTIATETAGEMRQGSFVQGTVFLVLRKRKDGLRGDLSEIRPEVQIEVRQQLQTMLDLDDKESPNFSDADYQLAAYAAAVRVVTGYDSISEINVARELARGGQPDPEGVIRSVIDYALREAADFLIPKGLERNVWKQCKSEERLYLKGIEVESHGDKRVGVYQEFARGFGVREYRDLLNSDSANEARLKTPSELKGRDLENGSIGGSLVRYILYAIYQTAAEQNNPEPSLKWLLDKYPGTAFDDKKKAMLNILDFIIATPGASMTHWKQDVDAARVFRTRLDNWGR